METILFVGSLVFAAVSYMLGIFSQQMGIIFIPICGVVFSVFFILFILMLPGLGVTNYLEEDGGKSSINKGFIKRNRYFVLVAVGICMVLIIHYMVNAFLNSDG